MHTVGCMPNKNGIDATKDIVSFDENAKVIMCSMSEHDSLVKAAREAGAIGSSSCRSGLNRYWKYWIWRWRCSISVEN